MTRDSSSLFKYYLLKAHEQPIPKCQKSSMQDRRLAGLSRDLLDLRQKKKVHGHWKLSQVIWEDFTDTVCHCREKILN